MSATDDHRPNLIRYLRKQRPVLADKRGTAMVEFALVAMPFLFLLAAITEMGLIFIGNFCLSNATLVLAREIRVGQIAAAGLGATSSSGTLTDLSDFKTAICKRMTIVPTSTCLQPVAGGCADPDLVLEHLLAEPDRRQQLQHLGLLLLFRERRAASSPFTPTICGHST